MNGYCLHLRHLCRILWHCITSLELAIHLSEVNNPASIPAAGPHDIGSAMRCGASAIRGCGADEPGLFGVSSEEMDLGTASQSSIHALDGNTHRLCGKS